MATWQRYSNTVATLNDVSISGAANNDLLVYNGTRWVNRSYLATLVIDGIAAGYTGSQSVTLQAGVQTTDATTTVLASIALAEGEMITVNALINGNRSTVAESIGGTSLGVFRRAAAGSVTLVGSVTNVLQEDFSGAPTFTMAANTVSQTVEIRVTGEAAKTVNWTTAYNYMKTLTNS